MQHERLRTAQAFRPLSWTKQWPDEADLIRLRDQVSPILLKHLHWVDEAFIPQDRLNAVFHSRYGLRRIPVALKKINLQFGCDIPLNYIINGEHSFEDLLRLILKHHEQSPAGR